MPARTSPGPRACRIGIFPLHNWHQRFHFAVTDGWPERPGLIYKVFALLTVTWLSRVLRRSGTALANDESSQSGWLDLNGGSSAQKSMPECGPLPPAARDGRRRDEPDGERWFALSVMTRRERVVSQTLRSKGCVTLLPVYTKRRQYAARFKECELPLFPGYLFCRFNPAARMPILTTPGVIQVVGAGREPVPVDASEIESLQTAIRSRAALQPCPFPQSGQKVRITDGPMAGITGVVMSVKPPFRMVISITLLQRSVLLEIDAFRVRLEQVSVDQV
jgi:transcription antitermination factor NusG